MYLCDYFGGLGGLQFKILKKTHDGPWGNLAWRWIHFWTARPPDDILFLLLILFPLVLSQLLIKTLQQFIVVGSSTASSSRQRCPQRENPFLSLVTNRFAGPTLAEGLPALQNQPTTSPAVNSAQLTAQSIPLSALLSHPCLSPWICPGA